MQAAAAVPSQVPLDLASLSAGQVAELMTQFATTGYSQKDRDCVGDIIAAGCARFMLNGPALLAERPEDEVVARKVLAGRKDADRMYIRDGAHYAVLEFIRLARAEQKLSLGCMRLPFS